MIDLNRYDAEKTRTELVLARMRQDWSTKGGGSRYFDAVLDFLQTKQNDNSLRVYAYSVLEFFEWQRQKKGYTSTPELVTRSDAATYVTYLGERDRGLEREWLEQDKGRELDLVIYDVVRDNPGIRIGDLRRRVAARAPRLVVTEMFEGRPQQMLAIDAACLRGEDVNDFPTHLGCLVHASVLRRKPSLEELRSSVGEVAFGITPEQAGQLGVKYNIEPEIFRYYVAERTGRDTERAGTVATRLAALSSLWDHMIQSGENRPGAEGLLRYNIWDQAIQRVGEQARAQAKVARENKTPDNEVLFRLLATTFTRTHKENARAAAEVFFYGTSLVEGADKASFRDLRDRVVMLLLGQLGLRRSEIGKLRRKDAVYASDHKQGVIAVTGKRNKVRQIGLPKATWIAMVHLDNSMREIARKNARVRDLLETSAPIAPVTSNWGANKDQPGTEGLSPVGVTMMLRRRARQAGYTPESPDWKRIHAHGFRHAFVQESIAAGTPLPAMQAQLGHSSVATTGIYAEERRPEMRIGKQFQTAPELPQTLAGPPPKEPVRVVEGLEGLTEKRSQLTKRFHLVSRPSGFVWWLGTAGNLKPPMPVMSPAQAGECGQSSVCGALADLWRRWAAEKGPTATMALTAWVHDALAQASLVEEVVAAKLGHWVPFDAPANETAGDPDAFREHSTEAIVEWFEKMAFEHKIRVGQVKGMSREEREHVEQEVLGPGGLAPWFGEADPVASLPTNERERLLEWLVVLQGKKPPLSGVRGDAAAVIDALCQYDAARGVVSELVREAQRSGVDFVDPLQAVKTRARVKTTPNPRRAEWEEDDDRERGASVRGTIAMAEKARQAQAEVTNRVVRRFDPGFDVEAETERRVGAMTRYQLEVTAEKRKLEGMTESEKTAYLAAHPRPTRPTRDESYLGIVRRIFGTDVADDETIGLLARCSEVDTKGRREVSPFPLNDSESRELFRVDWGRGTIVHTAEFAREFAQKFKQHSECVARRIARELWDLKQKGELKTKEVVPVVESMRAFRVPCPAAQEDELRRALGEWREPMVFFEEWKRGQTKEGSYTLTPRTTKGEDVGLAQLGGPTESRLPQSAREERSFRANARSFSVNPVTMLMMVYR